jgi:hypothetical protein
MPILIAVIVLLTKLVAILTVVSQVAITVKDIWYGNDV